MNKYPLVSIIIATLNSSRILPKVLKSIRRQTYPTSCIEILVIDGGSTDDTKKIASSFGCRIIDNSRVLPIWAKYIGYKTAQGKYVLYLDSDEVIENAKSIERRIAFLTKNPSVHAVTGSGYKSPRGYPFLNQYINEFGDPFSFFYYHLSKDCRYFLDTMKYRYRNVADNTDHSIFGFSKSRNLPLLEFAAMGGMIDLNFFKSSAPEIIDNPTLIAHFVNLLVTHKSYIAIMKHDALIHYSSDTLKNYLGKIISRVVNNVYTPAKEGFTGRDEFASCASQYKKYLFLPYALLIIGPLIDAFYLSITRRHTGYFIHVPLSFYTACLIVFYMCLKLIGIQVVIKSYGELKPLSSQ